MIMELFNIEGKKAIVTGGTRGLGHGMAEGLMEAGCEVAIVGTSDKVYDVAKAFCDRGFKCHGVKADFSKREQVYQGFNDCVAALGGDLDIIVNAHGIQRRHSAEVFPIEEWDEVLNVNLNSVFILCQEAAKIMLKKGYGKIINIASMNAVFGGTTVPAYTAAKGAVAMLTKSLASDCADHNICCNAIAPGYMDTEMCANMTQERKDECTKRIPAARWGLPDDLKGPVLFLASDASDYLNGAVIPVDGGFLVKS